MTIKEVCEKYGITADTLRYYEKVGVIPTVGRTKGGKRDYSEQDIAWVENAICMRNAGLPVEMLIEYVRLFQEGDGIPHINGIFHPGNVLFAVIPLPAFGSADRWNHADFLVIPQRIRRDPVFLAHFLDRHGSVPSFQAE